MTLMFILPIESDNPVRHRPYALYAIIAVNVVVFVLTFTPPPYVSVQEALFRRYGFIPAEPSLATGVTSMFLHAGFAHLLGNMFFFWMFGDNVEDILGELFFLLSYFLCGAAATLGFLACHASSPVPLVGASGAISGIAGLYLVFFPRARAELVLYVWRWEIASVPTTTLAAVGVWFGEQTLLAVVTELTALKDYVNTAFLSHVGGFVAG